MTIKRMTPRELAEAILAEVGEDQTRLNMAIWCSVDIEADQKITCGTTLCVGGWGAYLLGYDFDHYGLSDVRVNPQDPDSEFRHISDIVQEALELTNDEANYLFHKAFADEALDILHDIEAGLGFPKSILVRDTADAY